MPRFTTRQEQTRDHNYLHFRLANIRNILRHILYAPTASKRAKEVAKEIEEKCRELKIELKTRVE